MSFDTDHVRNAGDPPGSITGLPTYTELLTNPALASIYTAIRSSTVTTGPELVETADVSKKTVYEYLRKLSQAGLITEADTDTAPTAYEAADFELTVTVGDVEVTITPVLVDAAAHAHDHPVISRVLEDDGVVTFALAHDLVMAHNDGGITTRQISELTELSHGTVYDLLEALYDIHGLSGDGTTTYTPEDLTDDGPLLDEGPDQ